MNIQMPLSQITADADDKRLAFVHSLLEKMTLNEKLGQMQQMEAGGDHLRDDLAAAIAAGRAGSVINQTDPDICREMQRIAVEDTRLGIPLMRARDVIHGFKSVFPIPLGQAASWNPDLVREACRMSANEAAQNGVHWTFAPMIDISRDARWGRVAESFGEDPHLTSVMGVASIEGYQGDDLSAPDSIAACAKHFAGYGASESGRDYNTTNIPVNELRNIYLEPFRAAVNAGCASFMASFSDIDGIPATANEFLLQQVLREEWQYDGLTISDWNAVAEMCVHGLCEDERDAALQALNAGIDIEMVGTAYVDNIATLLDAGAIDLSVIDQAVTNILMLKARLGLFDAPYTDLEIIPPLAKHDVIELAKQSAIESCVLLKNDAACLPLKAETLKQVALIGPLADAPDEQLGTWIFDGDVSRSVTPRTALSEVVNSNGGTLHFAEGVHNTRTHNMEGFADAIEAATNSEAIIACVGEDAILSGEAHCRADITFPGAQLALLKALKTTGKPLIVVVLAGRPLIMNEVCKLADAVIYAWHPGMQTGPALCDIIFGKASPSGKLPVTFPKSVGQIPIYYNHKMTGRPATPEQVMHIDNIPEGATQTSFGMTSFHLDDGFEPEFPFGFGLSYGNFTYTELTQNRDEMHVDESLNLSIMLTNTGTVAAQETVQLYIRDHHGSLTRPIKELKQFQKIHVSPGESMRVTFEITQEDLAFYGRDQKLKAESGKFSFWIGPDSAHGLQGQFNLL